MNNVQYPESIYKRITNDFLKTFKDELELAEKDESIVPDNPTYWNYYQWFDNTCGFDKALKIACGIHNLNDLYAYRDKAGYPNSDLLGGKITELLYERGIVNEGDIDDAYPIPFCLKPKDFTEEELEEFLREEDYTDNDTEEE